MKAICSSFLKFVRGVFDDYMLAACMLTPVLMGALFRLGIPRLEMFLCTTFSQSEILAPYYLIFDLVICVMTPIMYAYAGVMTMLEEFDNGTARYLMVTPIGRSGYFVSRIGFGTAFGAVMSTVTIVICGLSGMSLGMIVLESVFCAITSLIIAVFVISFAGNKVEGMALVKLSSVLILGIPAVFFLPQPLVYLAGIFPSYWFTLVARERNLIFSIPTLLVSAAWFALLYRKFCRRLV